MATNEDLWRLCTDWLIRCKVIPPEHKANAQDSEIKVSIIPYLILSIFLCYVVKIHSII